MNATNKPLAALGLIINAFVWGVSWWPFRLIERAGLHPLWTTGLMFAIVVVVVTAYRPRIWVEFFTSRGLWLLAIASGLTNVAFNWAVTTGDVVRVVLLFYLMPAWALLLARWLLKEPLTAKALMRLAVAVTGVLFVLKSPDSPWPVPSSFSDWMALGGGFAFALTNVLLRKFHGATDLGRLFAMFVGGAAIALVVAMLGRLLGVVAGLPGFSWTLVIVVLAMSFLFLFGNLALQYGASRLTSSTTSLVMLTEIIFASLSSLLLGAAVIELRVIVGAAFILSAALWAALG